MISPFCAAVDARRFGAAFKFSGPMMAAAEFSPHEGSIIAWKPSSQAEYQLSPTLSGCSSRCFE
jgi:hypothetical protein